MVLGALAACLFLTPASPAVAAPGSSGDIVVQAVYVGMPVCVSGRTGYRCGSVTATNQTVCSPTGCVYGLARTNIVAQTGDAGAPVYHYRTLVGTVVGSVGGYVVFDPI